MSQQRTISAFFKRSDDASSKPKPAKVSPPIPNTRTSNTPEPLGVKELSGPTKNLDKGGQVNSKPPSTPLPPLQGSTPSLSRFSLSPPVPMASAPQDPSPGPRSRVLTPLGSSPSPPRPNGPGTNGTKLTNGRRVLPISDDESSDDEDGQDQPLSLRLASMSQVRGSKRPRSEDLMVEKEKDQVGRERKGACAQGSAGHPPASPLEVQVESDQARRQKMQRLLWKSVEKEHEAREEVRHKFYWLDEKNIRDGKGLRPNMDGYDARTLKIPADMKLSNSQKQYWGIKKEYRDVLLFFKVGKFYELYEEDAQVGHDELGWKLTVSGVGHCRQVGCPESGIDVAVSRLVSRGYKVGLIEQLESSSEAKARGPSALVRRELVKVFTSATLVDTPPADQATHLLAITQPQRGAGGVDAGWSVGFAFMDAAEGKFHVGEITDDSSCANLTTLLQQVRPGELVFPQGALSGPLKGAVTGTCPGVVLSPVTPGKEFPEPGEARRALQGYFNTPVPESRSASEDPSAPGWLSSTPTTALAALAALALHCNRLKLATELTRAAEVLPHSLHSASLVLDGATIRNLELLEGSDGGMSGSLLSQLDRCVTPQGRRRLRAWVTKPLTCTTTINHRLDAVESLLNNPAIVSDLRTGMKAVGDLDRVMGRVRAASAPPPPGLPDAMLQARNKRRLAALGSGVREVRASRDLLLHLGSQQEPLTTTTTGAPLLLTSLASAATLLSAEALELLDEITSVLRWPDKASAPQAVVGIDSSSSVEKETEVLCDYLNQFLSHVTEWAVLSDAVAQIDVLCSFALFAASGTTGPLCRPQVLPMGSAPAFLHLKSMWNPCAVPGGAAGCVVPNDVTLGREEEAERVQGGPRGSLDQRKESKEGEGARSVLLTGPNMGGKSTLLRGVCVAAVMAHMGCFVAASQCRMMAVDTVFTRLGAHDRIMQGESTFYVECSEAARILNCATANSLVVLDELGRGTSTFDGYAIAYATFRQLSAVTKCRLLFATHYHPLTSEFGSWGCVALRHMAALVREGKLVFLYSLRPGACPKSYGMQVALLAGIPQQVVDVGSQAAKISEAKQWKMFEISPEMDQCLSLMEQKVVRKCFHQPNPVYGQDLSKDSQAGLVGPDSSEYEHALELWTELTSLN